MNYFSDCLNSILVRFLHILVRQFGIFSARIPTYLVVRYLNKRGHQNIILNNDHATDDEERESRFVRSIGTNHYEKFLAIMRALLTLNYDVVIVYDTLDAMLSSPASLIKFFLPLLRNSKKWGKKKFIYYNLELFSLDYTSPVKKNVGKTLEQIFIFGCDAFVALSPIRLNLAERIFKITCKKFVVPNSFDFEAKEIRKEPYSPFKLLYAGGIEDYIFDGFQDAEFDFEFTIHGISKYGIEKLMQKLKGKRNIVLDLNVIKRYDEFAGFVSRYDAGFVWYPTRTLNERFAGLSSSKYFRYLSLGKPVITRNLPEIAEITMENNFGTVINDFSELNQAVSMLSERYSEFVDGILQNYYKFEFSRNFSKVYEFLVV